MKLMPASSARWTMRIAASWSVSPQAPNIIAPRHSGLTWTPVPASVRCCMPKHLIARRARARGRLGAVALLELLAAPAPAGLVAPHLVFLVDHPLLDDRQGLDRFTFVVERLGPHAGCRGGRPQRPGAGRALTARVGHAPGAGRVAGGGEGGDGGAAAVLVLDVDLDVEDHPRVVGPDAVHEVAEQREGFVLVRHERVDLGEASQVYALAQVVHVEEMLAPALVDDLQQQEALERAHELLAERLFASPIELERRLDDAFSEHVVIERAAVEILVAEVDREELAESGEQPVEVPVLDKVAGRVLLDRPF